jgi:transposase-like protein
MDEVEGNIPDNSTRNQRILCVSCGKHYTKSNKSHHDKTQRHKLNDKRYIMEHIMKKCNNTEEILKAYTVIHS